MKRDTCHRLPGSFHDPGAISGGAQGRRQGPAREGAPRTACGPPAGTQTGGPGGHPRRAGQDTPAVPGPHPLRPDAREPFCLPAGFGGGDGGRPGAHPGDGPDGPGLRRHARGQLRRLRLGRAQPRVRDQRFRRNPAGSLGVGPQTPGRQRRRGRPLPGRGQGPVRGGGPRRGQELPQAHARVRARWGTWTVWYSRIDEQDVLAALSPEARAVAERIMAKARQRGHLQVLEKMAELVDDRHRIVEDAPLIVRETHTVDGQPVTEAVARTSRSLRRLPSRRPPDLAGPLPDRGRGPEGRRRRQRRHPLLGHPDAAATAPTTRCSSSTRKPSRSVLAPYSKTPAWDCRGRSVSWSDSGSSRGLRTSSSAGGRPSNWREPLLHAPAPGHEGRRGVRRQGREDTSPNTASSAGGPWPWPMPSRATPPPLPATLARATAWTRPWPASPLPMRSRPTATTTPSSRPPGRSG